MIARQTFESPRRELRSCPVNILSVLQQLCNRFALIKPTRSQNQDRTLKLTDVAGCRLIQLWQIALY